MGESSVCAFCWLVTWLSCYSIIMLFCLNYRIVTVLICLLPCHLHCFNRVSSLCVFVLCIADSARSKIKLYACKMSKRIVIINGIRLFCGTNLNRGSLVPTYRIFNVALDGIRYQNNTTTS